MPRRVVPPAQLSAQPVSISLQKLCPQVNRMTDASPSSWWSWHNEQNTWAAACSGSAAATVACRDRLRTFFGTAAAARFFRERGPASSSRRQRRTETLLASPSSHLTSTDSPSALPKYRTCLPFSENKHDTTSPGRTTPAVEDEDAAAAALAERVEAPPAAPRSSIARGMAGAALAAGAGAGTGADSMVWVGGGDGGLGFSSGLIGATMRRPLVRSGAAVVAPAGDDTTAVVAAARTKGSAHGRGVGCESSWKRRVGLDGLPVRVLLTGSTAGVAVDDDGAGTPTAELELCTVLLRRRACGGVGGGEHGGSVSVSLSAGIGASGGGDETRRPRRHPPCWSRPRYLLQALADRLGRTVCRSSSATSGPASGSPWN